MFDRFVKSLQNTDFGSGTSTTPQFDSFIRKTRNDFRKYLSDIAENIDIRTGHFYFSGFLTRKSDKQAIYFSISDVRFFPKDRMLIRTAANYKDFCGGSNRYVDVNFNFGENFRKAIQKIR